MTAGSRKRETVTGVFTYRRVPCYNAHEGCTETIVYYANKADKPLRKVCLECQRLGAPSTRGNLHLTQYGQALYLELVNMEEAAREQEQEILSRPEFNRCQEEDWV